MAWQEQQQPWWERPATTPGQPDYEAKREHLRAELARAWHADPYGKPVLREKRPWGGPEAPRAAA